MTKLLLASLLALPAVSLAQPRPPTPPGPPPLTARPRVCKQGGPVLFEIDENKAVVTKLFVDGAFDKKTFDEKGKLTSEASGCMDDGDLRRLTKELRAATWRLDPTANRCAVFSDSMDVVILKVDGHAVYAPRVCGVPVDAASEAASLDAQLTLQHLTYDPLTHSPGKPVK